MKKIRLAIVGFGVVGQGLAELLLTRRSLLNQRFDLDVILVSVANARHGLIYNEQGLDISTLLALAAQRKPLTEHPDVSHWSNTLEGLRAINADVLAEVTGTNLRDAEPGISHIRSALTRGMHVVTANKGPVALAGQELLALARSHGVQLHMESTVMAGTPVLSTIQAGIAGAQVYSIRGILNGTTNYILSAMAQGRNSADVLAEAQAQGYAEADPTADVEGYDVVAKTLILSSLVFDCSLKPGQVMRRGITGITPTDIQQAHAAGRRIKLVASLYPGDDPANPSLQARVEPVALPEHDPLAHVDGVMNAITISTDTLADVTITGPGAGRLQTGQGLLSDLIAIANSQNV
jgi:homoserine dehydrogenase